MLYNNILEAVLHPIVCTFHSPNNNVTGKNLCILLQVNHWRDVACKLKLYIIAHLWEPRLPVNEL